MCSCNHWLNLAKKVIDLYLTMYEIFLFEILIGRYSLMCKNQFIIQTSMTQAATYEHVKNLLSIQNE